jgi:hypothetical protein
MWRMRYSGRCSVPLARTATGGRQPDSQTVRFIARIIKHAHRASHAIATHQVRIARRSIKHRISIGISIAASASYVSASASRIASQHAAPARDTHPSHRHRVISISIAHRTRIARYRTYRIAFRTHLRTRIASGTLSARTARTHARTHRTLSHARASRTRTHRDSTHARIATDAAAISIAHATRIGTLRTRQVSRISIASHKYRICTSIARTHRTHRHLYV